MDDEGRELNMKLGPYGYYISREDGRIASLPREFDPDSITVSEASTVLEEKGKFSKTNKDAKKAKAVASKGGKSPRKTSAPGKPRKANPFINFMKKEKDRVVKANPDKTWQECLKIM